ncbi:MAG: TonB-dependent receptor [Muribaculaceae bacterium]|nr:TonB-dependent receptor [Muribaculaceae bacterium]
MTRFAHYKFLSALLFLSLTFSLYAYNISGVVKDSETKEPLMEAAVKLVSARDTAFVAGVTTNVDGKFNIRNVKAGKYIIQFSYVGYADVEKPVTVASSNVRMGEVQLRESSEVLGEVSVVATKTPIKVMEDTVEYNADSYHTQPNAVVEDLLKRLPGVEVDSDGKITANGKDVKKILIDGKEFFSDDPQVASKNLPVSMIEKLQVVDRKSDMARLTGVDDGEDETVINLTVKRGMNQGWFGTAEGGYGTDDRYAGSFNVNRFWDGNQITFLGNLNNTNQLGFTDSNGNRFRRFGGNNGITTSRSFGINFNVGKDEILRVGGDILYSNTDRTSTSRTSRQWNETSNYENIEKYARDRGNNLRGDFRVLWNPDSFNTLEFRPNFSLNHNKSLSWDNTHNYDPNMSEISNAENKSQSRGNSFELGGRLIYSHRFKQRRGRSFSVSMQYSLSNVREKETSYSHNMYLLLDSTLILDQYANNHTWSNQVMTQLTWTEPLGDIKNGNSLVFSYRMNYRWNNADKLVYNLPEDYDLDILPPVGIEPDPTYSNRFRNNYFNQNISMGYKKTSQKYNMEVGLALVPQMSKSTDLINSDRNIDTRWVWNYAPYMRMRYRFSKQTSLMVHYRGRSSQPSLSQLQPVADVSNPMNIVVGNPDLDPSFSHNMMVRFQDFNMESQRSLMFMGNFQLTQNSIISKTTLDPATNARTTTYVNANGVWNGRLMNMFSMPLRNKKWRVSNHIFVNGQRTVGFTNDKRNAAMSVNIFESPGISFRPDNFEFEIRPQYSIQTTHYSLKSEKTPNKNVQRYGGRADISYYTSWGLTLQTDINYSATEGYSDGYNTRTTMWNASISQQFLRNKSLTLSFRMYDILNQRKSISHTTNDQYIQDTWSNTLGRYGMVSLTWRFNTFGKGKEPGANRGGWGGPGGHGGPGRPPRH